VSDVIDGVTLTLSKAASTATLTVERDTTAVTTAVTSFVTAYNDLYTSMKNTFAYKSGSALAGDSTLRSLQSEMREIVATAASGGTLANLFEVGVSSKSDGTLQLDSAKLSNKMSTNFSDVAGLFNSATGFGTRFDTWSSAALAFDGAFANRTSNFNQKLSSISTQRVALETRMSSLEKMYRQQYSQLNVTLAGLNKTSSYLTQQLAKL